MCRTSISSLDLDDMGRLMHRAADVRCHDKGSGLIEIGVDIHGC